MQTPTATLRLIFLALTSLVLASRTVLANERLSIIGLFKNKAIVLIDGKQSVLSVGQATPGGLRLLAADSREAVFDNQGQQQSFKLGGSISSVFSPPPPETVVQVWPDAGNMYKIQGSLNNFPVSFLIDTGATLVAMNETTAKRIGLAYKQNGVESTAITASGTTKSYLITADKVRVGGIEVRNVGAAVLPGDYPREILLGNSFLSHVNMTRNGQLMELRSK